MRRARAGVSAKTELLIERYGAAIVRDDVEPDELVQAEPLHPPVHERTCDALAMKLGVNHEPVELEIAVVVTCGYDVALQAFCEALALLPPARSS